MIIEKLHKTVKSVTDLLAQERYEDIAVLCNGVRITASEIRGAVIDYGNKIIPLPPHAFKDLDVIAIANTSPQQWSVNVPVFTAEEGCSDLTLELTLIAAPEELYKVELDNLHVM